MSIEHTCMLSCVQLFVTPWTVDYQIPQSMGFSRQEFWSALPFSPPEDLSNPGVKPASPEHLPHCQAGSLPLAPCRKSVSVYFYIYIYIYIVLYRLNEKSG